MRGNANALFAVITQLNQSSREKSMKHTIFLIMAMMLVVSFTGCTSKSTKMKNKEQGATSDARITLTKKYTDCVSKAAGDKAAIEACDAILESIKKLN